MKTETIGAGAVGLVGDDPEEFMRAAHELLHEKHPGLTNCYLRLLNCEHRSHWEQALEDFSTPAAEMDALIKMWEPGAPSVVIVGDVPKYLN